MAVLPDEIKLLVGEILEVKLSSYTKLNMISAKGYYDEFSKIIFHQGDEHYA